MEMNRRRPHVAVLKIDEDELRGSALGVQRTEIELVL
jgi:hypothetical protein